MSTRALTRAEISSLELFGCVAEDWQAVSVTDPFNPERIRGVAFSGRVSIGRLGGRAVLPGAVEKACGLYGSRIHSCSFGNDVLVDSVGILANYDLEDEVVLFNVQALVVEGRAASPTASASVCSTKPEAGSCPSTIDFPLRSPTCW